MQKQKFNVLHNSFLLSKNVDSFLCLQGHCLFSRECISAKRKLNLHLEALKCLILRHD